MQAILALEDGRVFRGKGYGARLERTGEVVFNTSITGYQEIFTDPSYAGQIVCLTNPEIGNYGTNPDDEESGKPYIEGLIVREFSPYASNYRSEQVTDEYLERHRVPVLSDIDTRALVRHLRDKGVMRGTVSTREMDVDKLIAMSKLQPTIDGMDLAKEVCTKESYVWTKGDVEQRIFAVPHTTAGKLSSFTAEPGEGEALEGELELPPERERKQVIAYDYGIKTNILSSPTDQVIRMRSCMRRRRSAGWRAACRSSASASAISSLVWRWKARLTSSSSAITAAIIRSSSLPRAKWRLRRTTTIMRSIPIR